MDPEGVHSGPSGSANSTAATKDLKNIKAMDPLKEPLQQSSETGTGSMISTLVYPCESDTSGAA